MRPGGRFAFRAPFGVLLAWLALAGVARATTVPCLDGRYLLNAALMIAPGDGVRVDAVQVLHGRAGVSTACRFAHLHVGQRGGARWVRAAFHHCGGAVVRLEARVDAGCSGLRGRLRRGRRPWQPFVAARSSCGDGVIDPGGGEQCESGDDCPSGLRCARCACVGGTASPSTTTTVPARCGDGVRQAGEACDGADIGGASCPAGGGEPTCRADCTLDYEACCRCGNGVREAACGEVCDGSDLGGDSCHARGYEGGRLGCLPHCLGVSTDCFFCGDGTRNGDEECDGADFGGATCDGPHEHGGPLVCSRGARTPQPPWVYPDGCRILRTTCYRCGDGKQDPGEECDDGNLVDGDSCTAGCLRPPATTTITTSTSTSSTSTSRTSTSRTTSTSVSTTTSTTIYCFTDPGDGTVKDNCTGLQWEKKTTAVGSGMNPADLHDVDNQYAWAGCCNVPPGGCCGDCTTLCQPNSGAQAACRAQTPSAQWASGGCNQCPGGGTCNVNPYNEGAITTVWDWVHQLNAAHYAGHTDWRLPVDDGWNGCAGAACNELSNLFNDTVPGCNACQVPCIDPIFGPTEGNPAYWSATTAASQTIFGTGHPTDAWEDYFLCGGDQEGSFDYKDWPYNRVRAVRNAP